MVGETEVLCRHREDLYSNRGGGGKGRYLGGHEIWFGFWKMDGLLKVDIGQIGISGRKNISRLLYSKHRFLKLHSLPHNTFWLGLSVFFLTWASDGRRSRGVEVIVLKTWGLVGVAEGKAVWPDCVLQFSVLLSSGLYLTLQNLAQLCHLSFWSFCLFSLRIFSFED